MSGTLPVTPLFCDGIWSDGAARQRHHRFASGDNLNGNYNLYTGVQSTAIGK